MFSSAAEYFYHTGNDKRGWSRRGQILYPILSEDGKLLACTARDPQFETKEQASKWQHPFASKSEPFDIGLFPWGHLDGQSANRWKDRSRPLRIAR